MISVTEAKQLLIKNIATFRSISVNIADAVGYILAEDVHACVDVPVFDNSAMDGYAVKFIFDQDNYHILGQLRAGDVPIVIKENTAVRIFTGAPIPIGADTVVQQEICIIKDNLLYFDPAKVVAGQHIRHKSSQCKTGDIVARKGTYITPGGISMIVSAGVENIKVYDKPSVAIIVTGNELQQSGETLRDGKIYNSNSPAVISYLKSLGVQDIESHYAEDNLHELRIVIKKALASCDVLIITGGISVGDYDYTGIALLEEDVNAIFYKIKQKPGKPMYAGKKDSTLVFALPGNPSAVLTCFNQYVKPTLLTMMGHQNTFEPSNILPILHDYTKNSALTFFLKARMADGEVEVLKGQESFNLSSYNEANCFIEIQEEKSEISKGTKVKVYEW